MRSVLHLLRADVRHFRWALVLWTVLVVADTAIVAVRPAFMTDMRTYGNVGLIGGLVWSALQIGTMLIVPLIVQAHPAVGSDAFWMTRPIAPRSLFTAKLLLLGTIVVLLGCAVRLTLMLWIHVPVREALLVTLDSAIGGTAWLAVLTAAAAVTLNLPRFALLCGAAMISLVLLTTVVIMRTRFADSATTTLTVAGAGQPTLPPAEDSTEAVLFLLCVAAAGFGLAAIQYRTRLRRISVPVAVGGLALAMLALPYWPLPLLKVPPLLPDWAGAPSSVQLRVTSPVIAIAPQMAWVDEGETLRSGSAPVVVAGLEPGWTPRLDLLAASLTLDNGSTLGRRGSHFQSMPQLAGSPDHAWQVAARQVLGVAHVEESPGMTADASVIMALSSTDAMPLPAQGRYRGDFAVQLTRWEVVAALPLAAGAAFQDQVYHYRFALEHVTAGPGNRLTLRAREWRATSPFDRLRMVTYTFYVRNARQGRAMGGSETEPLEGRATFSAMLPFLITSGGPSRFFYRAAVIVFPPYALPGQAAVWDPAWYAESELMIVRRTESGSILRTLEIPRVSVVARQ